MIVKPKCGMYKGMFRHLGMSSADKKVANASCSTTPFDYQQAANDWQSLGYAASKEILAQTTYNPPSNQTVCRVDIEVASIAGTPATVGGYTFNAIISTMTSADMNLTTLHTTYEKSDNVTGITTAGWKTFSFTNHFAIANGTSYVVGILCNTVDGTNYLRIDEASDAGDDWLITKNGDVAYFNAAGAHQATSTGVNLSFKIYGWS